MLIYRALKGQRSMERTKPLPSYQPEEKKRKKERNKQKRWAHTVLLHHREELDDDLGAGADEDLALAALLGVVDGVERIVEDGGLDHFGGLNKRF